MFRTAMPFNTFRKFAESRLEKRHEVNLVSEALREKVHADLSAAALKGTEVLDESANCELACAKVSGLLESVGCPLSTAVCSAISARSASGFERQMARLARYLSENGLPDGLVGVCESAYFEAANPGRIEAFDVDRLTATIVELNLKRAKAASARLVKCMESLDWGSCRVDVEIKVPQTGLMASCVECRIDLPSPCSIIVGFDMTAEAVSPCHEAAIRLAESLRAVEEPKRFGKYYVVTHVAQRGMMESKVRDAALGIRCFLPGSTAVSLQPVQPSPSFDVWRVRLDSGSVNEALCETNQNALIRSISRVEVKN